MVEQTVIYLYYRILLKKKKKWTINKCKYMDESPDNYAVKKANPKKIDSIYIAFLKWKHYSNGEQISGCPGLRRGCGLEFVSLKKGNMSETFCDGTTLNLECDGAHMNLHVEDLHRSCKWIHVKLMKSKLGGWIVSMSISRLWYCTILM